MSKGYLFHRVFFLNSLFNFSILVLNEGLWSLVFIVSSTLGTNWIQLKRFQVLINQTLLLNDHRILNYEYCILINGQKLTTGKGYQSGIHVLTRPDSRQSDDRKEKIRRKIQYQQFFTFSSLFSSLFMIWWKVFFWERGRDRLGAEKADFFWAISSKIIKKSIKLGY